MRNDTLPLPFEKLRFRSVGGDAYRLGEPLQAWDGERLLGTLDPLRVSPDASEVQVGPFIPSLHLLSRRWNIAPLVLVETTAYIAEQFESVQRIHFSLAREIATYRDGKAAAVARTELLQSIGVTDISISPKPDSDWPGNFVVQGLWVYSDTNLMTLRAVLLQKREEYRLREYLAPAPTVLPIDSPTWVGRMRQRVARLIERRPSDAD